MRVKAFFDFSEIKMTKYYLFDRTTTSRLEKNLTIQFIFQDFLLLLHRQN